MPMITASFACDLYKVSVYFSHARSVIGVGEWIIVILSIVSAALDCFHARISNLGVPGDAALAALTRKAGAIITSVVVHQVDACAVHARVGRALVDINAHGSIGLEPIATCTFVSYCVVIPMIACFGTGVGICNTAPAFVVTSIRVGIRIVNKA